MQWLIDAMWEEAGRCPGDQYEVIGIVEAETVGEALAQVTLCARPFIGEYVPTVDEICARR